ncbi:hypothetical protein [Bartonella sp. AA23NXGY]
MERRSEVNKRDLLSKRLDYSLQTGAGWKLYLAEENLLSEVEL